MSIKPRQLKVYTTQNLDKITQQGYLPIDTSFELEVVSKVVETFRRNVSTLRNAGWSKRGLLNPDLV